MKATKMIKAMTNEWNERNDNYAKYKSWIIMKALRPWVVMKRLRTWVVMKARRFLKGLINC